MFYGEYSHSIDRKGRLIVPAKFRQVFQEQQVDKLFLTRGLDGCLFLFTGSEWRSVENRFRQVPFTRGEGRKFNRLFFSGATEVSLDSLGRILVPKNLKEYAAIVNEVVFVGVSSRMEVWSREKWDDFYNDTRDSFEEMAEQVLLD